MPGLRGPLREWAEALLDAGRLRRKGFFHTDAVRTKWKEHLSGVRNWQYLLRGVLMFRAWLDRIRAAFRWYHPGVAYGIRSAERPQGATLGITPYSQRAAMSWRPG